MDVVDFGWFQPQGQTGIRLSWDRPTGILFLFHANSATGSWDEPIAEVSAATARYIGDRWLEPDHGPEWVRAQVGVRS